MAASLIYFFLFSMSCREQLGVTRQVKEFASKMYFKKDACFE